MDQKLWLVCYDIRCARRLRAVGKLMGKYGNRVQKSVFECWLTSAQLAELQQEAQQAIDTKVDSLRVYTLCSTCIDLTATQGHTEVLPNSRYFIC